jgi:hypothetical protein
MLQLECMFVIPQGHSLHRGALFLVSQTLGEIGRERRRVGR